MLMQLNAAAQSKSGIENYNFLSSKEAYVWVPVVHHVNKKGIYTEMRYNYEGIKTASLYAGKSFSKKGLLNYTITPMLGIVVGKFNGGSFATNADIEYKKILASVQTQYTISSNAVKDDFFFNWTEIAFKPLKWFYAGLSMQQTKLYSTVLKSEYGILAGFVLQKFTIPIYVFNPFSKNKNFIIGINTEW